MTVSMMYFNR